MIDVKGAFDHVHRDTLIGILEKMALPSKAVSWVYHFLSERETSLVVDGKITALQPVLTGIPQGSPISPLLFLLYTAPLYEVIQEQGGEAVGYVDDITISVTGVLNEVVTWARQHPTEIDFGEKLGFIRFFWWTCEAPSGATTAPASQ
jgi:hypothetical protein